MKVLLFFLRTGFVIFRIRVRRGGRKRPVPKGATYGKPKSHGVNQLKPTRKLQSVAEVSIHSIFCESYCAHVTIRLFHNVRLGNFYRCLQERVGRRCGGLRVLNSYWVAQDSTYMYYEVILVDPAHKVFTTAYLLHNLIIVSFILRVCFYSDDTTVIYR